MHTFVKRLLAAVLIFALTVPICAEIVKTCDRQAALAVITQQTAYPEGFAESAFRDRTEALQRLVETSGLSGDADFSEKVKTAFTEMYHLVAESLTGEITPTDASFVQRAIAVFDLLFELDRRVQSQKEVPDLTAEDGFVAFGALVWSWAVLRCPHCGASLPLRGWSDVHCPHCGKKLEEKSKGA